MTRKGKRQPHTRGFPGEKYGRLVIIDDVPVNERKNISVREIKCRCDCGNIVNVRSSNLFSGNTSSCGCLEKELAEKRYTGKILGKRFGRLVAIGYERDHLRTDRFRYICKCDCGNIHKALANDLIHGRTTSCGCYRKEFHRKLHTEDITGQTFNELTAIKQLSDFIGNRNYRRTRWLFRCSCGKEIEALAVNVKHGRTKSCGHLWKSIAELQMTEWLKKHNVRFEKERGFDDLRNPKTGYKLMFDFKIYREDDSVFVIEHQGSQHFTKRDITFGKQQREETDQIKRDYCNAKGIRLYETRYNEDYITRLEDIIKNELEKGCDSNGKEVMKDGKH